MALLLNQPLSFRKKSYFVSRDSFPDSCRYSGKAKKCKLGVFVCSAPSEFRRANQHCRGIITHGSWILRRSEWNLRCLSTAPMLIAVCGLSAVSAEKNVRLLLAHIRDHLLTNLLSYVDALVNLADLGTKVKTSLARWRNFAAPGLSHVSFLGRVKAKEANIWISFPFLSFPFLFNWRDAFQVHACKWENLEEGMLMMPRISLVKNALAIERLMAVFLTNFGISSSL